MFDLKARFQARRQALARRRSLRRICRQLHIKPYYWKKKFALGRRGHLCAPPGRATGKTMAVMLRLLVLTDTLDFKNSERRS